MTWQSDHDLMFVGRCRIVEKHKFGVVLSTFRANLHLNHKLQWAYLYSSARLVTRQLILYIPSRVQPPWSLGGSVSEVTDF